MFLDLVQNVIFILIVVILNANLDIGKEVYARILMVILSQIWILNRQ